MTALNEYSLLFDRRRNRHDWLDALAVLRGSPYPENRALAGNWGMDHRVSRPREEAMLATGHLPGGEQASADFTAGLRRYFATRLCVPPDRPPDYAAEANAPNRIAADTVAPGHPLFHIASLSALLSRALASFDLRDLLLDLTGILPPDPEELSPHELDRIG